MRLRAVIAEHLLKNEEKFPLNTTQESIKKPYQTPWFWWDFPYDGKKIPPRFQVVRDPDPFHLTLKADLALDLISTKPHVSAFH